MALEFLYLALKLKDLAIYQIWVGVILNVIMSMVSIATATTVI